MIHRVVCDKAHTFITNAMLPSFIASLLWTNKLRKGIHDIIWSIIQSEDIHCFTALVACSCYKTACIS